MVSVSTLMGSRQFFPSDGRLAGLPPHSSGSPHGGFSQPSYLGSSPYDMNRVDSGVEHDVSDIITASLRVADLPDETDFGGGQDQFVFACSPASDPASWGSVGRGYLHGTINDRTPRCAVMALPRLNFELKTTRGRKTYPGRDAKQVHWDWRPFGVQNDMAKAGSTALYRIGREVKMVDYWHHDGAVRHDGGSLYLMIVKKHLRMGSGLDSDFDRPAPGDKRQKQRLRGPRPDAAPSAEEKKKLAEAANYGVGYDQFKVYTPAGGATPPPARLHHIPTAQFADRFTRYRRLSQTRRAEEQERQLEEQFDKEYWSVVPVAMMGPRPPPITWYCNDAFTGYCFYVGKVEGYVSGEVTSGTRHMHQTNAKAATFPDDNTDAHIRASNLLPRLKAQIAHL